jgi:hypothetical protein
LASSPSGLAALDRVLAGAALGLQIGREVALGGPAIGVVLERLLGVEADQAQRAVEAVDPDGVAVDHLGDVELAEDEPGGARAS